MKKLLIVAALVGGYFYLKPKPKTMNIKDINEAAKDFPEDRIPQMLSDKAIVWLKAAYGQNILKGMDQEAAIQDALNRINKVFGG